MTWITKEYQGPCDTTMSILEYFFSFIFYQNVKYLHNCQEQFNATTCSGYLSQDILKLYDKGCKPSQVHVQKQHTSKDILHASITCEVYIFVIFLSLSIVQNSPDSFSVSNCFHFIHFLTLNTMRKTDNMKTSIQVTWKSFVPSSSGCCN